MSRELVFRDGDGVEYQPVRHHNRKTGKSAFRVKPPGASNETDDCVELDSIEETAKAMLVDMLPARVKALAGGPVNYLKFGAQKLVSYELDPEIAERIGVPATSGTPHSQADRIRQFAIQNYVQPARDLAETHVEIVSGDLHTKMGLKNALPAVCSVLEGKALADQAKLQLLDRQSPIGSDKPSSTIRYRFALKGSGIQLDMAALERLKLAFLGLHPDFTNFADTPSFASNEGDYKQALVDEAQRLLSAMQHQPDGELGGALIELLAGRTELFCNLIDWHAMGVIDKARKADTGVIETAAGALAKADNADESVIAFVKSVWPLLRGDPPINPYAESRMLPTMLRALIDPESVLAIRSTPTDNAARALLDRPAFANAPISSEELASVNAMAREIMRVMGDEWGWAPRHLWDVQGFIWETCQKRLPKNEMTDDELLARFDTDARFRAARADWSLDNRGAFCAIARAVHEAGFDWFFVGATTWPLRFGIRDIDSRKAKGVVGGITLSYPYLELTSKYGVTSNLEGVTSEIEIEALVRALLPAQTSRSEWVTENASRQPYWPDEYHEVAEGDDKKDVTMGVLEPTNLILYGPPGTGKTYRTMQEAVRYCGTEPDNDRDELRKQYDQLRKEKRIEFVTFHQNYAYEEFVEGLRPETGSQDDGTETGGFRLESKSGLFRQLCTRADEARKAGSGRSTSDLDGRTVFKMSLGRAGLEDEIFEDAWEGDYIVLGWGGEIDWSDFESYQAIHDRWNLDHPGTHGSDSNIAQVNRFVVDMKNGDLVVISYGNTKIRAIAEVDGPYEFAPTETRDYNHRRKVKWLRRFDPPIDSSIISNSRFSQKSCYPIREANLLPEGLATLLPGNGNDEGAAKQYVLVIDEINRANISKVFGELITLIEPDKRLGMAEELKVRLPYSEDEFGVPANLHIIGTMNTADRSIALLDTALRRRFRFEEMSPDTTVDAFIEAENQTGLPLSAVLETMNRKIEYLVDRDHRIGHAFFIGCKTKEHVDAAMRDKVIPLLQEYFFDDWNRLAAVLGEKDKGGNFLECETIEDPMGEGNEVLKSWRVRKDFDHEAYDRMVDKADASAILSTEIGQSD